MYDSKVKRKTFVAREDLLDRLSEVAKDRGYSLYALVNEVFELALKAEEMGLDLKRVIDEREILEVAKKAGFVLGLESLWYDMADLAYGKAKGKAVQSWFEAGVWFAKRYAASESGDAFEVFIKDLMAFSWGVPELSIKSAGNKVFVRVISPRFTEAFTFLFASFLEGALSVFGFKNVYREVFKGRIFFEAVKEGGEGEK